MAKKIVLLDWIGENLEPYDRKYILGEVAGYCHRNPSILRNPGATRVWHRGYDYANGRWNDHCEWVVCVCFEIDELTEAKWDFLLSEGGIGGSWAVDLKVLPDDREIIAIPGFGEFKK